MNIDLEPGTKGKQMKTKIISRRVQEAGKAIKRTMTTLVLATGMVALTIGCGSTPPERTAGDAIDDQAITRRIQEALSSDPAYKFGDVKVTTYQGKVQLSGFVDRDEQRGQAEDIARRIRGVKEVVNDIAKKR